MDIKTPEETWRNITFEDSRYRDLVEKLKEGTGTPSHHLCLFLGTYLPAKQEALEDFAEATGRQVEEIDLADIVSRVEKDTYANIDELFMRHGESESILYFRNGDRLCGAYTGFTHSMVKYATPQERYFLERNRRYPGLVIVDISEAEAADETIRRAAHSVINFRLPASPVRRFLWHLKNYSLHGFEIKTTRPDAFSRAD